MSVSGSSRSGNLDPTKGNPMESATARTLQIDGMTGDVCVQKVTTALKGVHDVSTQSVKVGEAHIKADQAGCKAACAAVDRAGYPASESGCDGHSADKHADQNAHNSKDSGIRATAGSVKPGEKAPAPMNAQKPQPGHNGNTSRDNQGNSNPRSAEPAKPATIKN